jgi:hypothetical protein
MKRFTTSDSLGKKLCFTANFYVSSPIKLEKRVQGFQGSRIQVFFSKDFISAFNILSISAMSFFAVPNSPFLMNPKSPANNI